MFIQAIQQVDLRFYLLNGASRTFLTAAVLAFGLMASSCHREACPGAITRTDQPQEQAIEASNPQQSPDAGSAQQGKSLPSVRG